MNCTDAWKKILQQLIKEGIEFNDNRGEKFKEILNTKIAISETEDYKKPIELMIRKADFIYPRIEEMENLVLFSNDLNNFSNRMHENNQLYSFVIPLLKKDPNTRRAVMTTYNPKLDSNIENKTTISILSFFFRIVNKRLNVSVFIRSLDCFLGLPANIVQVATIQREVCKHLALQAGSITFFAGSAHIFEDNFETMNKVLGI